MHYTLDYEKCQVNIKMLQFPQIMAHSGLECARIGYFACFMDKLIL